MFSTTTPLQIKNNPVNNSTAKNHWSFGKSNRFPSPKSNCNKPYYDRPSSLSERKAAIGYGNRVKYFDGNGQIPEGGKYEVLSDFNEAKNKKGFSFTANRQNLKFDHFQKTLEATPSPLTYQQDSNQVKTNLYFSMRPKTAYPKNYFLPSKSDADISQNLPGPGKYETIDTIGKKYHTKSPNHHAKSFASNTRFHSDKATPGPQDYPNRTIEPDGIYLLSNMKGSGRRSFLKGRRNSLLVAKKETPGPGNYRAPSDFGHYESPIQGFSTIQTERADQKRPQTALH